MTKVQSPMNVIHGITEVPEMTGNWVRETQIVQMSH